MSASKRVTFAVTISWLSKFVTILANLFLMPILFHSLGKEELGIWFLLGNSQAFLGLLGFGIAPVLSRHIAFAKGASGSDPNLLLTEDSQQHISDLIVTGRTILQWLSVFVFLISWLSGYGLISHMTLREVSFEEVFWSWILMCLGYAIGTWVSSLSCWLEGLGYIGWDSTIAMIVSIVTVVSNIIVVIMGGGLLSLSVIAVISGLLQRLLILVFIRFKKINLSASNGSWNLAYATNMIKPSFYFWLTSLGMFLILKTDQYFITVVAGVEEIPAYNAAYQLASNLRNVALPFALSASPFISQMWRAGDLKGVHQLIQKSCNYGLLIMCVGSGYLIVMGENLTNLWLGSGVFAGSAILATFCIMFILEVQNVCLMYGARATEYEEFAISSLGAGLLNIIFTAALIKPLGLWGVALGTLIGQSLTSNWYMVFKSLHRLKITPHKYFFDTFLPAFLVFSASMLVTYTTKIVVQSFSDKSLILLLFTAIACGSVFVLSWWLWAIENSLKKNLIFKIKNLLTYEVK
jgi:O-antigen/teichoic acid export membrane protein